MKISKTQAWVLRFLAAAGEAGAVVPTQFGTTAAALRKATLIEFVEPIPRHRLTAAGKAAHGRLTS